MSNVDFEATVNRQRNGEFGRKWKDFGGGGVINPDMPSIEDRLVEYGYATMTSVGYQDTITLATVDREQAVEAVHYCFDEMSEDPGFGGMTVALRPTPGGGFLTTLSLHQDPNFKNRSDFGVQDASEAAMAAIRDGRDDVSVGITDTGKWRLRGNRDGQFVVDNHGAMWAERGHGQTTACFRDVNAARMFMGRTLGAFKADPESGSVQMRSYFVPGEGHIVKMDSVGGSQFEGMPDAERAQRQRALERATRLMMTGHNVRVDRTRGSDDEDPKWDVVTYE
jgi:hypothetical protein